MTSAVVRQLVVICALALVPAAGEAFYLRRSVPWQSRLAADETVDLATARSWGDNVIWIDARPDNEFAQDHIPGALSLNVDRWNELFPSFVTHWSPDKKIVVYCSSKSCNLAEEVARRLRTESQLPNDIRVLQGGWEEWLKQNR